jgi:Bacterial SH3 domain
MARYVRALLLAGSRDLPIDRETFAQTLVSGLNGAADLTGQKKLTGTELHLLINSKLRAAQTQPEYVISQDVGTEPSDFVFALSPAVAAKPRSADELVIGGIYVPVASLALLSEPRQNAGRIKQIAANTPLKVLERVGTGDWYRVSLQGNVEGYALGQALASYAIVKSRQATAIVLPQQRSAGPGDWDVDGALSKAVTILASSDSASESLALVESIKMPHIRGQAFADVAEKVGTGTKTGQVPLELFQRAIQTVTNKYFNFYEIYRGLGNSDTLFDETLSGILERMMKVGLVAEALQFAPKINSETYRSSFYAKTAEVLVEQRKMAELKELLPKIPEFNYRAEAQSVFARGLAATGALSEARRLFADSFRTAQPLQSELGGGVSFEFVRQVILRGNA